MIFQPPALALLFASSLNALMLTGAGLFALYLLVRWNPASGGEAQIALERRTHLASTLVALSLVLGLPALALFVHTADAMAPFFIGAMCAIGSLKANVWGFPALYTMLAGFFLAAAWLVLNHLDNRGWDYPLIRPKYGLLLLLAPLALAQAVLLWLYFLDLQPAVITSCCGSLFGPAAEGVVHDLAALPVQWARPAYGLVWGLTLAAGGLFLARGRGGRVFGVLSGLHLPAALAAVVAFVSLYIYEEPNHHCPFCLLQAEHGHAGWLLYPLLFLGTAAGVGAGLATTARTDSLKAAAPRVARKLAWLAMGGIGGFGLLAWGAVWRSNLVLG
ncbi:MAG: hypothetical protein AB1899_02900 [Pseudomonadota bacterium]